MGKTETIHRNMDLAASGRTQEKSSNLIPGLGTHCPLSEFSNFLVINEIFVYIFCNSLHLFTFYFYVIVNLAQMF